MNVLPKSLALSVTVLMLTGSSAFAAGSSTAGFDDCEVGEFCGFHNAGFGGTVFSYSGSQANLGADNDEADSAKNRSSTHAWVLYEDDTWGGNGYCLPAGWVVNDLDNNGLGSDDMSSIKELSQAGCGGYNRIGHD